MSTNKSFYRYEVKTLDDVAESTYARRLTKSLQNNKNSFFFSVSEKLKYTSIVAGFLKDKWREQDYLMTSTGNHRDFCGPIKREHCILNISTPQDLKTVHNFESDIKPLFLLLTPLTKSDLKQFIEFASQNTEKYEIYWLFSPYDRNLKNSLTVNEISKSGFQFRGLPGLEIFNIHIPAHHELEPTTSTSYQVNWQFEINQSRPAISVLIPTYNNVLFLSNVIWHLIEQDAPRESYEIVVVDDGSDDRSSETIFNLFEKYKGTVNLKYIYWSKNHPVRGEQRFFRPGLARNLAARYSRGKYLLFLDSDMLTPKNFIKSALSHLQENEVIQFQRYHIHQELSRNNPAYEDVDLTQDVYIEEKNYWSELFFCNNWSDLPNYWKYTCTYALGISRTRFYELGLFKKYYVSYGFEDTDLGYEAFKKKFRFCLVKIPLLHLTSYDMMQYRNSVSKRFSLLSKTAELFYLQHLDREIYHLLGNYYRFQKPLKSFIKDLF